MQRSSRALAALGVGVIAIASLALGAEPASAGGGGRAAVVNDSLTYVTYAGQVVTCPVSVTVRFEDDDSASSDSVSSTCAADIYTNLSYDDQDGNPTYSSGAGFHTSEEFVGVPAASAPVKTRVSFEFRDCNPNPSSAGCSLDLSATAPK